MFSAHAGTAHSITIAGTGGTIIAIFGETYTAMATYVSSTWYISKVAGSSTITGSGKTISIGPSDKAYCAIAFNGDITSYK